MAGTNRRNRSASGTHATAAEPPAKAVSPGASAVDAEEIAFQRLYGDWVATSPPEARDLLDAEAVSWLRTTVQRLWPECSWLPTLTG